MKGGYEDNDGQRKAETRKRFEDKELVTWVFM